MSWLESLHLHALYIFNTTYSIYLSMEYECGSFYSNSFPFPPSAFVVAWEGELLCRKWDCECAFKRQRGCCCANSELQETEDQIFVRMMDLSMRISQLGDGILEVIGTLEHGHW